MAKQTDWIGTGKAARILELSERWARKILIGASRSGKVATTNSPFGRVILWDRADVERLAAERKAREAKR